MRRRVIELSDGPRHARRAPRRLRREESTSEMARDAARASSRTRRREARVLLPRGAALAAPQRRPVVRRDGDRAGHGARAGRVHPDGAGDHRRGQRGARPRHRRRLPEAGRQGATSSASAAILETTPHVKRVQFISKEEAYAEERKRNPEAYKLLGLQPAAGHVPHHPGEPGQHHVGAQRARAAGAGGRPRPDRRVDRRGPQPRGRHRTRSSPPRAS